MVIDMRLCPSRDEHYIDELQDHHKHKHIEMSQWIRGPICGVDNCRSRLYRSTDGMKICQYGHVMEGNVEINDDQDENFVSTRRLNLQLNDGGFTVALQNVGVRRETSKKVYGTSGKKLYWRCLQVLLKKQIGYVQEIFPCASDELVPVVKLYWLKYMTATFSDDAHSKVPTALDLISILYIAIVKLQGFPIYVCDVIYALKENRIPYMKCLHLIPNSYLEQLPSYFIKCLEPYKLPVNNELYEAILINGQKICGDEQILEIPFNYYYPLIFKILAELLVLPNAPSLFHICNNLVEKLGHKFQISFNNKVDRFPELQIISFIIITIKIYFIYFNGMDYNKWIDILTKYELNTEFHFANSQVDNDELLNWSDFKIDKYCQWLYDNVLGDKNEDNLSVMDKRLYKIFDLNESLNASPTNRKIDNEQDKDPSLAPLSKYLEEVASNNIGSKIKTSDVKVIEDKLFDKFSKVFGISKKLLSSCSDSVELEIKQHLMT